MLFISHKDIVELNLDPLKCYEWVDYVLQHKSDTILPAKLSLKPSLGVFYNVMPSMLLDLNVAGVKVVSRYPERSPALDSQILLFDTEQGQLKAIMDGNYITTMRTGAVAVHSINLLAKSDFKVIGMIGLGNQARATMKVFLHFYPDKEIILKLYRYHGQELEFQQYLQQFKNYNNLKIEFCDSYEATIKGSDIIISSVTYFENDIVANDCFDLGCLVIPIHTRGFTNCDLFFDKVYADDTDHVKDFKNFSQFKKFNEISDVLKQSQLGRSNDQERILVYNIGISVHDIYFANQIYQVFSDKNGGRLLEFEHPTEKFWI